MFVEGAAGGMRSTFGAPRRDLPAEHIFKHVLFMYNMGILSSQTSQDHSSSVLKCSRVAISLIRLKAPCLGQIDMFGGPLCQQCAVIVHPPRVES